jgi:uncharacterized membrane protein YfcA
MHDPLWSIPLLFLAGAFGGLIDSIAGGGGLITLTTLLALGLPPQAALGTNKFQSSFGSLTATAYHIRKKNISLNGDARFGVLCTFVGAALGAWAVQQIHSDVLGRVIPFLLIGVLIYSVFTPKLGEGDSQSQLSNTSFYLFIGTTLGFYDGFFGQCFFYFF